MAQVMKGLILGSPGVVGSPALCILYGQGSPVTNPDPYIGGAALGSLYIDNDSNPTLWFKTAPGTWTQISIP